MRQQGGPTHTLGGVSSGIKGLSETSSSSNNKQEEEDPGIVAAAAAPTADAAAEGDSPAALLCVGTAEVVLSDCEPMHGCLHLLHVSRVRYRLFLSPFRLLFVSFLSPLRIRRDRLLSLPAASAAAICCCCYDLVSPLSLSPFRVSSQVHGMLVVSEASSPLQLSAGIHELRVFDGMILAACNHQVTIC